MIKVIAAGLVVLLGFLPIGCATTSNTASGAAIGGLGGATAGAIISRATGGSGWAGAAIGAIAGTVAGSVIGNTMDQNAYGQVQPASSDTSSSDTPGYQQGYSAPISAGDFMPGRYYWCTSDDAAECLRTKEVFPDGALQFNTDSTGFMATGSTGFYGNDFKWQKQDSQTIDIKFSSGFRAPLAKPGSKGYAQVVSDGLVYMIYPDVHGSDDSNTGNYYLLDSMVKRPEGML